MIDQKEAPAGVSKVVSRSVRDHVREVGRRLAEIADDLPFEELSGLLHVVARDLHDTRALCGTLATTLGEIPNGKPHEPVKPVAAKPAAESRLGKTLEIQRQTKKRARLSDGLKKSIRMRAARGDSKLQIAKDLGVSYGAVRYTVAEEKPAPKKRTA